MALFTAWRVILLTNQLVMDPWSLHYKIPPPCGIVWFFGNFLAIF